MAVCPGYNAYDRDVRGSGERAMGDIYVGSAIMGAVTVVLAVLGQWIGRRWPRRRVVVLLALVVVFMLLFAKLLLDSVWMLRLLPFSNAIVVANWQLPASGLVSGWRGI